MFKRSFINGWFYLPVTFVFLLFASYVWYPGPVIVPGHMTGFFEYTETTVTILLAAFCCFTLINKYEIELGLVCGTSTLKLFISKVLPIFVYTIIPMFVILGLYEYVPYSGTEKAEIAIFVPENWKIYAAISFIVSFLFFFSLFCFLRVLMRNCYVPLFVCMFFHAVAYDYTKSVQYGNTSPKLSIFNPYISVYMLSDKIPDMIAGQHEELSLLYHAWSYNRIIFFVLGIVLIAATCFMLKRETLHKGFGD